MTDLQLAVMNAVWSVKEGTVAEIHEAMADRGRELAPTTVATMLQRLDKQGWVKHKKRGRVLVYRAGVEREVAARSVLDRVMETFFGGRASALTAHLIDSASLSKEDVAELRSLLDEKNGKATTKTKKGT